jgi:NAD-dependent dihydropyrimidine dehydrogenase PreA subunit
MPYIIAEPCINVKDKACVEVCPVDCIYEGETMLFIHPDECIDCGACEPVCPVEAISQDRRVGDDELDFVEDNRRFFTEVLAGRDEPIGAPGGSHTTGAIGVDTPMVAAR